MAKKSQPWQYIGLVSAIGTEMAITTIGGFYLGNFLDRLWGTEPIFLLVGVLIGLAAGIGGIILLIKTFLGE